MSTAHLTRAAWLMLFIVLVAVISWETFLRNKGFETSYDDDPALWTHKRHMVYEPADLSTVFIGSSRIKFDLDIATWEQITGNHAVQLACVGSSPLPVLDNLAADENFKGKLVVDVAEGLFFSTSNSNQRRPTENLKYYHERTPAQWVGFHINHFLESKFALLNKEALSLSACMDKIPLANRTGVKHFAGFPSDFGRVKFSRQEYMTDKFSADTNRGNIVKNIWKGFAKERKDPPVSGARLDSILQTVKLAVDKIKARGGQVLFVRPPSSGWFSMVEGKGFPREKYWDRILSVTGCPGIHYKDYPAIANFVCPEDSHLSLTDARTFTTHLIQIIQEEKGWRFSNTASK
jgi:hypothetical protein